MKFLRKRKKANSRRLNLDEAERPSEFVRAGNKDADNSSEEEYNRQMEEIEGQLENILSRNPENFIILFKQPEGE